MIKQHQAVFFLIMMALTNFCDAQEMAKADKRDKNKVKPSKLTMPSLGLTVPILTSAAQCDEHVGQVVVIRGRIGNTKIPRIIGVEVDGGHEIPDAFAIGVLAKFVTTQEEWDKQRAQPGGAGSFGPGANCVLYHSLSGDIADAKAWGTGATGKQNRVTIEAAPTKSRQDENSAPKPKRIKEPRDVPRDNKALNRSVHFVRVGQVVGWSYLPLYPTPIS